ncbi:hypothetical protein M8C21_026951 [Ambrosia artemisiifolia]|uniref:Uncharacterized protein n=1 Tax=Ambrosia artemisiifolia TaxID=4212 RepID=A0AAD5BPW9_AMBAR|nr:hypothetical protein M8C21_026951 [Ambrosia artemisiifolia]
MKMEAIVMGINGYMRALLALPLAMAARGLTKISANVFTTSYRHGFTQVGGDTSQEDRLWLRHNSTLLITNPDILHMSILPLHKQFGRLLSNLRYVVIDVAYTYKGSLGCHVAPIIRKFRRLCSHVLPFDLSFLNHQMQLMSGAPSMLITLLNAEEVTVNVPGMSKTETDNGPCVSVHMPGLRVPKGNRYTILPCRY